MTVVKGEVRKHEHMSLEGLAAVEDMAAAVQQVRAGRICRRRTAVGAEGMDLEIADLFARGLGTQPLNQLCKLSRGYAIGVHGAA